MIIPGADSQDVDVGSGAGHIPFEHSVRPRWRLGQADQVAGPDAPTILIVASNHPHRRLLPLRVEEVAS